MTYSSTSDSDSSGPLVSDIDGFEDAEDDSEVFHESSDGSTSGTTLDSDTEESTDHNATSSEQTSDEEKVEDTTDEDAEARVVFQTALSEGDKYMQKRLRSAVRGNLKVVIEENQNSPAKKAKDIQTYCARYAHEMERPLKTRFPRLRKPGPFRFVEIFTGRIWLHW